MKKFQFRLQKLLWFHQQRQKQAEVKLQQAALQREAALSGVLAVQRQIDQACSQAEQPGQLVNIAGREAVAAHLHLLNRNLTAAREKLKVFEQLFREAETALLQITRDVEGLLSLRAQQFAEHQDEVARQHQILLDEVVMRQWSLKESDPSSTA